MANAEPPASSYLDVASALLEGLDREPRSAIVGGVAVAAHGYVRATRDIDLVVGLPLTEAQARLAAHGIATTLQRGDPLEGDFSCLKGTLYGVPFDLIPALVPIAWERCVTLSVRDKRVQVVDLDSLIALKLRAGSIRDVLDVAMLVLLHPDREPQARAWAHERKLSGELERCLADPRHRALAATLVAERAHRHGGVAER